MSKRPIEFIAIHCTGASQQQTVDSILRYWKEVKGWKSPGYHRLIEADGTIHNLLPFNRVSNGVAGYNSRIINICYIGGQHGDDRTDAQKSGLLDCIREALEWIGHKVTIQGHRDFPNVKKSCPSFDAKTEYEWITA